MFNKKTFLLATWYIFGSLVSSLYNKKKPSDLKKDLKKSKKDWEGTFAVLFENFLETQKNLFRFCKWEVLSEKNKKLFHDKKEELLKVVDVYKDEWKELLEELKVKWKDFVIEASEKLENLYKAKQADLEELKKIAPEKASELKDKLLESFRELKKKIK
jgi:hypothetical protein